MPNASRLPLAPYIPDITLDRSSPVPLYLQISNPSLNSSTPGVARRPRLEDELSWLTTCTHANRAPGLQRLVDRGLLTRRRGVGDRLPRPSSPPPWNSPPSQKDLDGQPGVQTTISATGAPATEAPRPRR